MEPRKARDMEALAAAAFGVFAERGYENASMRDVARAAGMAKGSVYYYVGSKEALLAAGLKRVLDALFEISVEPAACAGPPRDRLAYTVERIVEIALSHAPEMRVLLRLGRESRIEAVALERRRELERRLGALVKEAQADGERAAAVDPVVAGRLVYALALSVVAWYRPSGRLAPVELAGIVRTLTLEGLAPAVARQPLAPARGLNQANPEVTPSR